MKKQTWKRAAAGIMAMAMTFGYASAGSVSAADNVLHSATEAPSYMSDLTQKMLGNYIEEGSYLSPISAYTVADPEKVPDVQLPEKLDLRDFNGKNYVTPVKLQNPYGTCWAFASIAAAETSIAANLLDVDMNTATDAAKKAVDFSERQLAWFTYNPLFEDSQLYSSQAGEGLINRGAQNYLKNTENIKQREFNDIMFNSGGFMAYATSVFSSYQGPVLESMVPYTNDENYRDGMVLIAKIEKEATPEMSEEERAQLSAEMLGSIIGVPYSTKEGYQVVFDQYDIKNPDFDPKDPVTSTAEGDWNGPGWYIFTITEPNDVSSDGTWAVDESKRFQSSYELEQSNILPAPCTFDEKGSYHFNEAGLNAIKQELNSGKAVSIAFHADQSMPGQATSKGGFMNFLDKDGNVTSNNDAAAYWCQYTYDKDYDPSDPKSINGRVSANHAVTIIGYDDTIPKEYFNDPNGTIGGDGAFIIKNSWGSTETGDGWGSGGSGYFYLSYYDQSIIEPESFSFSMRGSFDDLKLHLNTNQMYDLMPSNDYDELVFDQSTSMANVFVADKDMILDHVGYTAVTANEQVTYDIYLMDEDDVVPTDGLAVSHLETKYQYGGFQRSELENPVVVKEGQKYAVNVTVKREDGNYGVGLKAANNEVALDYLVEVYKEKTAKYENELEALKASPDADQQAIEKLEEKIAENKETAEFFENFTYGNAVVNKGESLLRVGDTWTDWADILKETAGTEYGKYYDYDNFGIKSFGESEMVNLVNEVTEPKESYQAGDKVNCTIKVKNNYSEDLSGVVVYLGDEKLEALETMKPGETKTVSYTHTVTENEVKNGAFKTVASAALEEDGMYIPLNLMEEFSSPALTVSTAAASEDVENIAADEELLQWVKVDYEKKKGIAVYPEYTSQKAGEYVIAVKDKDGNVLDTYAFDPKTGIGFSNSGEINLPQTGVTSKSTAAAVGGALAMIAAGFWTAVRSLRKKKDE